MKNILINKIHSIDMLLDGLLLLIFFAIGIGRYRAALVLAAIMFIRFMTCDKNRKVVTIVCAPLFALALYLDIKRGQFFPVFPNLNPLISIFAFVPTEYIFVQYVKAIIPRLVKNAIFIVCPKCQFNNNNPTQTCSKCQYTNLFTTDNYLIEHDKTVGRMVADRIGDSKINKLMSKKWESALNLSDGEIISMNIQISPFRGVYKNGTKLFIDSFVLTQSRIILIKFGFICGGWTTRNDLPIKDIESVTIQNKWHHTKEVNLLVLKLINGDVYELFYSPFDNSTAVLNEVADSINNFQK